LWTGSPGIRGGAQEKPGVEGEERRQERLPDAGRRCRLLCAHYGLINVGVKSCDLFMLIRLNLWYFLYFQKRWVK
jgi:hypothetical protein